LAFSLVTLRRPTSNALRRWPVAVNVDGERLREAREQALLSRRELAEKSGVSMDTIQRVELGEGGAFGRTIRKLAEALSVDPQELLEQGKVGAR
jgi:transcriptional regulator with XRE-family HTH domain